MIDVVGVYDENFRQLFPSGRPIKAVVKPEAKLMQQPLETGATIVDHRILLPIAVDLSIVCTGEDYQDTYRQISELFRNGTLLTVQTRSGVYQNQVIEKMPHEESPDAIDALIVAVSLIEATFITPQYAPLKVRDPVNSSTVQRGEQQAQVPTETQEARSGSILSGIFR